MGSSHFDYADMARGTHQDTHTLHASLVNSIIDIRQTFTLRRFVTAGSHSSPHHATEAFFERDNFDVHSRHIVVKDGRQVVATARLCTREHAEEIGRFYSSTKFDIGPIISQTGNLLELSRISIHPDYQDGTALQSLWQGITQFCDDKRIDQLIGNVGIPLKYAYTQAVIDTLRRHYPAGKHQHVQPRVPLTHMQVPQATSAIMPLLLQSYLQRGARLWGPLTGMPRPTAPSCYSYSGPANSTRHKTATSPKQKDTPLKLLSADMPYVFAFDQVDHVFAYIA
ncbi:GNAT family N-acetyltransferase [Sulfuriflexus mobilis]|uniref:GNAT family N-acetyltransferase n=1 Tax=Sulfuriflexus mobilis TaxID=1811807 RepID=UPI000F81FE83|nr:GNAT family N-acetyltransferase [Sulfuriflexus mobilis]